jgi:hypothetical protein
LARLWIFALLPVVDGIRVIFDESRASVTRPVPCAKAVEMLSSESVTERCAASPLTASGETA